MMKWIYLIVILGAPIQLWLCTSEFIQNPLLTNKKFDYILHLQSKYLQQITAPIHSVFYLWSKALRKTDYKNVLVRMWLLWSRHL